MERTDELKERIRQQPLNDRLEESSRRIGDMCSQGRCPKMTIPVQHDDDDFYINTTLADAQATIAALQARVKELENELGCPTWVCDCCGRVSSMGWINIVNETMDGIDHDMECPNCHTRQIEEDSAADLVRERDEFESQLTQRTAELEAAKLEAKHNSDGWDQALEVAGRQQEKREALQAELERVRALIKALPKVEGEIADETILDLWESDAITFDALRGLLQHRQGMEGQHG